MSPAGPAADLGSLGTDVCEHGLHAGAQCMELQEQSSGRVLVPSRLAAQYPQHAGHARRHARLAVLQGSRQSCYSEVKAHARAHSYKVRLWRCKNEGEICPSQCLRVFRRGASGSGSTTLQGSWELASGQKFGKVAHEGIFWTHFLESARVQLSTQTYVLKSEPQRNGVRSEPLAWIR